MMMRFRQYSYTAIQELVFNEEVVRGNIVDPSNAFYWDQVLLNLPEQEGYDLKVV